MNPKKKRQTLFILLQMELDTAAKVELLLLYLVYIVLFCKENITLTIFPSRLNIWYVFYFHMLLFDDECLSLWCDLDLDLL